MQNEKCKIDDLGFSEEELFSTYDHSNTDSEKITAPRYSYWRSVFRAGSGPGRRNGVQIPARRSL